MEIEQLYQLFCECSGVTTDSRTCAPGLMFVALRGANFNGNAYAAEALQKGCLYAVVDEPQHAGGDRRIVCVEDSLTALQQLAALHRRRLGTPVIGVTGTNGKTTTKELLAAVLSQKYNVLYTSSNLNNHIGVPLTLLRLRPQHQLAVIEMGANHPGEIAALTAIAQPDCGLITNVGRAHLEGFGSLQGVIATKGELYDHLRTSGKGPVFIDNDNEHLRGIAGGLPLVAYGEPVANGEQPRVAGSVVECSPFLRFAWSSGGERHEVQTRLIGSYNLKNCLAAVAVGLHFGVASEQICRALAEYTPQNNRSQLVEGERNTLIVDAYNANPTSMAAALDNFAAIKSEHKLLILGDMKELGSESRAEHRKIAEKLRALFAKEQVWLVGSEFAAVADGERTFADASAVAAAIESEQPAGLLILIKGSNSMRLAPLAKLL